MHARHITTNVEERHVLYTYTSSSTTILHLCVHSITDIRLVDGNETSGLVEVFYDCDWKSVCDDYWTDADGNVACKHLGFLPYCKYHKLCS